MANFLYKRTNSKYFVTCAISVTIISHCIDNTKQMGMDVVQQKFIYETGNRPDLAGGPSPASPCSKGCSSAGGEDSSEEGPGGGTPSHDAQHSWMRCGGPILDGSGGVRPWAVAFRSRTRGRRPSRQRRSRPARGAASSPEAPQQAGPEA